GIQQFVQRMIDRALKANDCRQQLHDGYTSEAVRPSQTAASFRRTLLQLPERAVGFLFAADQLGDIRMRDAPIQVVLQDNAGSGVLWLPVFAFAGAAAVAVFIYVAAWKKGVSPTRMILVGLGVTALLEALKTLFLIFSPIIVASQAKIWITGTVYGANWSTVSYFAPWLLVLLPVMAVLVRRMDVQVLGNDLPIALGGRMQLQRFALIFTAAGLAGSAVAFVGGIGFIGLMAPHMSRRLVGGSHGVLLVCSAIVGAVLLVAADLVGRTVFAPRDVPAGVFTALLGAPFFLYMLVKVKKHA
ncbi:MAG: iron transporter permease, partial [Paenibacillus sp.]|nr:iron transporter permease [Paenibacillus sp.]